MGSQGGEGDINSGLDASLIARTVNDSVISAITDNGAGHSMKINRETERNERKRSLRPRFVNLFALRSTPFVLLSPDYDARNMLPLLSTDYN